MAAIVSDRYRVEQERLTRDPRVRRMAGDIIAARIPLDDIAWPDGTPRHGFMLTANREYGEPAGSIGAVARALVALVKKAA